MHEIPSKLLIKFLKCVTFLIKISINYFCHKILVFFFLNRGHVIHKLEYVITNLHSYTLTLKLRNVSRVLAPPILLPEDAAYIRAL